MKIQPHYEGAYGVTAPSSSTGSSSDALLALLTSAPENTWIKANSNTELSVWPPDDYKAGGSGAGSPSCIIRCWSGFAWDHVNCRLVIYGGGHANYEGNEIFVWDGTTRRWTLAFYSSDSVVVNSLPGATRYELVASGGSLDGPVSAHTYGNNIFLPVLGKFMTWGGANANTGQQYAAYSGAFFGAANLRSIPGYTLDLTNINKGYVAGSAGTNVHRNSTASVNLFGAQAWRARDYFLDHPTLAGVDQTQWTSKSCGKVVRVEGGKDVVYGFWRLNQRFYRIVLNDNDYRHDTFTDLMVPNAGADGWDSPLAYDPVNQVFLAIGGTVNRLFGFNYGAYSGTPIAGFTVQDAGLTGPDKAAFLAESWVLLCGICFDTINSRFLLWSEGGKVYSIVHSGGALTSGWVVTLVNDGSGTAGTARPKTRSELDSTAPFFSLSNSDTSTIGKWKWAQNLNCCIGLQGCYEGNVWLYKPAGWVAP